MQEHLDRMPIKRFAIHPLLEQYFVKLSHHLLELPAPELKSSSRSTNRLIGRNRRLQIPTRVRVPFDGFGPNIKNVCQRFHNIQAIKKSTNRTLMSLDVVRPCSRCLSRYPVSIPNRFLYSCSASLGVRSRSGEMTNAFISFPTR